MIHLTDIKELGDKIFLIGRDSVNQRVCIEKENPYSPYQSYFYIKKDNQERLNQFKNIMSYKVVDEIKKTLFGDEVVKVFYKLNYNQFFDFKQLLEINSDVIFEGDVFLRNLYALDILNKKKDIDFDVEWHQGVVDIETTTSIGIPDANNPQDKILCMTLYDNYEQKYYFFYWGGESVEGKENILVYKYNDELDMLKGILNKLKELSFDLISGWHVHFDVSYLLNRYKKVSNDDKLIKQLSPLNYYTYNQKYKQYSIPGLVIFDLLKGYMRVHRLGVPSYRLDSVAKEELGEQKVEVNVKKLDQISKQNLFNYNKKDVELCVKIDEKLHIFDFYHSIQKFVGCPFDNIDYASSIIDFLLLKKARSLNIVLPTRLFGIKRKEKIEGAFVDALPGNYRNIISFDLKAMYPSIIKTFNLSKETIDESGEIKLREININKNKEGILPQIIDDLLIMRKQYDIEKDKYDFDDPNHQKYDILIEAVKCQIDAIYGVNAYPAFRLFESKIASTITYLGREIIKYTRDYLKKLGYKIILTDTDSVNFISKYNTLKEIEKEGYDLITQINIEYKRWVKERFNSDKCFIKNAFKKIYKKMIIGAKKRYVGSVVWVKGKSTSGVEIVGFASNRSDYSSFARTCQIGLIKKLLDDESPYKIRQFIINKIQEIKVVNPTEIAIPTKIEKELDSYTTNLPKVRGAKYSGMILNSDFHAGDKPLLLFTEGESDIILFYDNKEAMLLLKRVKIDWDKMIERNIIMVVENLLENNDMKDIFDSVKMEITGQEVLGKWF